MSEEVQLGNQLQALLELHRRNRPVWTLLVGLMSGLLIVGIVQLILMFKILAVLKAIYLSVSST
ncbi:MAG TPA: hypothetical protein VFL79_13460 [Terriglobia bacterium]|nr:hypothetical protein [Terriglobia bacterium]